MSFSHNSKNCHAIAASSTGLAEIPFYIFGFVVFGADHHPHYTIMAQHYQLQHLVVKISERLGKFLVNAGVLTQDIENSYLTLDHLDQNPLQQVQGHSITYRIAAGPQQGKKVFALQTLLPKEEDDGRFLLLQNRHTCHPWQ